MERGSNSSDSREKVNFLRAKLQTDTTSDLQEGDIA